MIYFCSQKNRRALVLQSGQLNGIDYLEVLGMAGCGTQLALTFLKDARTLDLTPANISISGDTAIATTSITPASDANPLVVTVQLDRTGDFSPYTLAIVAQPGVTDPPDGMDPQLARLDFSFKAGCPTPADCLPNSCCPPAARPAPDINYLAKDYGGFLQTMLDRLAVLVPGWRETHAADLGVALVETLAYAADHLSYQQDAVSTEAYIGTARSRISLRRHARLVDYPIGEGCNARAWIYLETLAEGVAIPQGTLFFVRTPGLPAVIDPLSPADQRFVRALRNGTQPTFTSLQTAVLHTEQNQIDFYTWGDADCCLPAGATEATLIGNLTSLSPGTALVFEEVLGPLTGNANDADPTHRWAVRLTSVTWLDYRQRPLADPLTGRPITRIVWSADDALPFPLCLSATIGTAAAGENIFGVSVARGNIVPADHGTYILNESLGTVPPAPIAPSSSASCECGSGTAGAAVLTPPAARYYPELANTALTFSVPYDSSAAASAFPIADPSTAIAQISVASDDGRPWSAASDLLSKGTEDPFFIPEIDYDGSVFLRFGDGRYGMAPDSGLSFTANYRIGNGSVGNIGRDALAHIIFAPNQIRSLRNPLAAAGGTDPESMQHIRQYAPFAFETQERCVTESDYGQAAAESAAVRQARATLRWTGSWHTAFVSVEPAATLTTQLMRETTRRLGLLRMMGTDLAVEGAVIVGLTIRMQICVAPDHFQGDVFATLMKVFITGDQCNGLSGLLNAASFTFGEIVYASPLIAAAQAVEGVLTATLTQFSRMDSPAADELVPAYLRLGRLEIARCDNDPNHLDHGLFTLQLDGGK
jgi:hypothetical protein